MINVLSDKNQIREWMLKGLPNDTNSHYSAIFI